MVYLCVSTDSNPATVTISRRRVLLAALAAAGCVDEVLTAGSIWGNRLSNAPDIAPSDRAGLLGDSVTARGWWWRLYNYARVRCTPSLTWFQRAQSGANLTTLLSAQVPGLISDAPDWVIIECENEYAVDNAAATQANLEAVIDALVAGIPGLRWIAVLAPYAGGSEKWNPPNATVQAKLVKVQTGYQAACVSRGAFYIDIHQTQQIAEQRFNPTNAASGIVTIDNLHPSEYGNDGISDTSRGVSYWRGSLPDQDPNWWPTRVTSATLKTLLHSDSLSAIGDGDPLPLWNDQSGLANDFYAAGGQRPTYRAVVPVLGGVSGVQFDGIANVMRNDTLSISGAKTIFMAYALTSTPGGFGQYYSLLTLTDGAYFTEWFPAYNGPRPMFQCINDINKLPAVPFTSVGTDSIGLNTLPARVSCAFDGVDRQATSSYSIRNGDFPMTISSNSGAWARTLTDPCSLGGRLDAGGVGSQFTPAYIRAVAIFDGLLSTLDVANMNWWMRKTMPNPVPYL